MFRRAASLLSLLALGACGQTTAPVPPVQLYAMECGRAAFTDLDPFADDGSFAGQARTLVDPCYLIRHPRGDLIWDTGFPDAVADMPDGLDIPGIGARVTRPAKLVDQLAQLGLTPADIEFVSFSHAHGDHTGNGNLFVGAHGSSTRTNVLICSGPKRAPTRRASAATMSWRTPTRA